MWLDICIRLCDWTKSLSDWFRRSLRYIVDS